ncbi:hypothetical protein JCM6292_921 [Bacteroides pyogenes JCM 6292]|uniref:Uncharacterized protein n=1 Tax=Bacteroides pyogenes JCM 6292 TaxID=1235809 RepID=W4P6I3_9BACE|nr:hypothetical protein JCM6292_921 [Bacteroides pyogenes JCM 6292]
MGGWDSRRTCFGFVSFFMMPDKKCCYIKKENPISQILFGERKTGLKPATLSLEG